jgi:hypothetical protein
MSGATASPDKTDTTLPPHPPAVTPIRTNSSSNNLVVTSQTDTTTTPSGTTTSHTNTVIKIPTGSDLTISTKGSVISIRHTPPTTSSVPAPQAPPSSTEHERVLGEVISDLIAEKTLAELDKSTNSLKIPLLNPDDDKHRPQTSLPKPPEKKKSEYKGSCTCGRCGRVATCGTLSVLTSLTTAIFAAFSPYIILNIYNGRPKDHAFSLDDFLQDGFDPEKTVANVCAVIIFVASAGVNTPLGWDVLTGLADKLLQLWQYLGHLRTCSVKWSWKTAFNLYCLISSLGSAFIAGLITESAYSELEEKHYIEYLMATITTVALASVITLAGRYVVSRLFGDDWKRLYSKEDADLHTVTSLWARTAQAQANTILGLYSKEDADISSWARTVQAQANNNSEEKSHTIDFHSSLDDVKAEQIATEYLEILSAYGAQAPTEGKDEKSSDKSKLFELPSKEFLKTMILDSSHLLKDKLFSSKKRSCSEISSLAYGIESCAIGSIVYALKFGAFFRPKGKTVTFEHEEEKYQLAGLLALGLFLSGTTGLLYHVGSSTLPGLTSNHAKKHLFETINILFINLIASPSMFTVTYRVLDNYEAFLTLIISMALACTSGALSINGRSCYRFVNGIRESRAKEAALEKLTPEAKTQYDKLLKEKKKLDTFRVLIEDQIKPGKPKPGDSSTPSKTISQAHQGIVKTISDTKGTMLSSSSSSSTTTKPTAPLPAPPAPPQAPPPPRFFQPPVKKSVEAPPPPPARRRWFTMLCGRAGE